MWNGIEVVCIVMVLVICCCCCCFGKSDIVWFIFIYMFVCMQACDVRALGDAVCKATTSNPSRRMAKARHNEWTNGEESE